MTAVRKLRVLVTVRTYPTPALKGIEVSCTAGITSDRQWIRLFPVPYRLMPKDKRFTKYQWIELNATKAKDVRPESFTPDLDSIAVVSPKLGTNNAWFERGSHVLPLQSHCMCCIQSRRDTDGSPTLGFFKPREIERLIIEDEAPDWTPAEQARLRQFPLWSKAPATELEKIPFKFSCRYRCDEASCNGHTQMCTDWELAQSYRSWIRGYGASWEVKFRQRYEREMMTTNDTHFFVGTVSNHPTSWIIVGLCIRSTACKASSSERPPPASRRPRLGRAPTRGQHG